MSCCSGTDNTIATASAAAALSTRPAVILLRAGVSPRCALRFAGVRDANCYMLPDDVLAQLAATATQAEGGAAPAAADPNAVCPLCLGLLQQTLSPDSLADMAARVREAGYTLRSFALSVSVPPALLVRQRGAWLHVRKHQNPGAAPDGGSSSFDLVPFNGVVDVKDPLRWLLAPRLAAALSEGEGGGAPGGGGVAYDPYSPLTLTASVSHPACAADHEEVVTPMLGSVGLTAPSGGGKRQKRGYGQQMLPAAESTRTVLQLLASNQLDGRLAALAMVPPKPVAQRCTVAIAVERAPVCVRGKYEKWSRALPQTPWILDGSRKCAGSVQECVEPAAIELFGASEAKFHSAGREDVDVRMLGGGRPFVLELLQPRAWQRGSAEELEALAEAINANGLVSVSELALCSADVIPGLIKEGEDSHRKDYRCVVRVSRPLTPADIALLNETRELQLQQKTPLRVLHRRTQMVRPRKIHEMVAVQLAPRFLQLDLCTQAGTYVKEFVHSDFGRTHPSVGSLLGCEADILQLDVLGLRDAEHP